MDTVWKIVGYLSIPLVLVGVALMLASFRREQRITGRALLWQGGFAVVFLVVYQMIIGADMSGPWPWAVLLGGGVVGFGVGRLTRMYKRGGQAYARRSYWFLVPWALTFGFAQLIALGAIDRTLFTGVVTLYASTGIALGATAALLYQRLDLVGVDDSPDAPAAPVSAVAASVALVESGCPNCGTVLASGARFCRTCGRRVLLASDPAAPVPADGFVATHVAPATGLRAWAEPDGTGPVVATIDPGTGLAVRERLGAWALAATADGWSGWVDGRLLEEGEGTT
jgi:hypothetical protein